MNGAPDETKTPENNGNVTPLSPTARRIRGPPPTERPAYLSSPVITSHVTNGWEISCCSAPISNSQMLSAFEDRTKVKAPEMTYLENFVRFTHISSGKEIYLEAEHALIQCLKPLLGKEEMKSKPDSPKPSDLDDNHEKCILPEEKVVDSLNESGLIKDEKTTPDSVTVPVSSVSNPIIAKPVQVKFAAAWKELIDSTGMKQLDSIHDWTYTTTYNGHMRYAPLKVPIDRFLNKPNPEDVLNLPGTISSTLKASEELQAIDEPPKDNNVGADYDDDANSNSKDQRKEETLSWQRTTSTIDYELLTRRDPILFFEEIDLFEDELHDNGVSKLYVKLRVMPTCFFILLRLWVRVDYVVIRLRDYRFFHKFGTSEVLRETKIYEATMEDLKSLDLPFATSSCWRSPDEASQNLPLKDHYTESLEL